MGNDGSRVIIVDNIEDQLRNCESIEQIDCPVYGAVHYVRYNDMQFFLGASQNRANPHPKALHYLVPPNLLVISEFKLLEDICPSSLEELLQIISGVCEMAMENPAGIGYNRIAYAGRWGVVGEKSTDWGYKQILEEDSSYGVFLSPQQMISLSQNRRIARHSAQKSDVFAFGIMLVQMIFQEKLSDIFDYGNFELKLQPLLEKLFRIREQYTQYDDSIYNMFLGMLEIEEEDRFSLNELYNFAEDIRGNYFRMNNSSKMSSSTHSRGNRTPTRRSAVDTNPYNRTPKAKNQPQYRNDVSPLRSRFAGNPRVPERPGRTPERNRGRQQNSRSPLRRNLKINTQFERENQGYQPQPESTNSRRILSPLSQRHHR